MNMDPIDNEYGPDAPSAAGSDCEPDPEEPTEHERTCSSRWGWRSAPWRTSRGSGCAA